MIKNCTITLKSKLNEWTFFCFISGPLLVVPWSIINANSFQVIKDLSVRTTHMTFNSSDLSPPRRRRKTLRFLFRVTLAKPQCHNLFDPKKPINTVLVDKILKPGLNYLPSSAQQRRWNIQSGWVTAIGKSNKTRLFFFSLRAIHWHSIQPFKMSLLTAWKSQQLQSSCGAWKWQWRGFLGWVKKQQAEPSLCSFHTTLPLPSASLSSLHF